MGRAAKQRKREAKRRAKRDREIARFQAAIRPMQDDTCRRVEAEIRARLLEMPHVRAWHDRLWPVGDCEVTALALKLDMGTPSLTLAIMPQIGRHLFNIVDGCAVNLNLGRVGVLPLDLYLRENEVDRVYTATDYLAELWANFTATMERIHEPPCPDEIFTSDALMCKAFGCPPRFGNNRSVIAV